MKRRIHISIVAFLFVLIFTCCSSTIKLINENDQLESYSVEELIEVYKQYNDKFNNVAGIVLKNDSIKQIMLDSKEETVSIWTETKSESFSKEEWSTIKELFHITGMNRIERSIKSGKDVINFIFRNSNFTTELFYCVTNDEQDLLYHKQRTTIFQKIDENWWVGYSSDSNTGGRFLCVAVKTQGDGSSVLTK